MATVISESLDALRRTAMPVILNNTTIKFSSIEKALKEYIVGGDGEFKSLLNLMQFNKNVLDSSQISACYLLAYMDFFAIYTLIYSNYIPVFENLKSISENKYKHIYNLYKDLNGLVKNKQKARSFSDSLYNNFIYANKVRPNTSAVLNRENVVTSQLDYSDICTLPTSYKKEVVPSSIVFSQRDNSNNIVESMEGRDFFKLQVLRKQNNKIGTVETNGVRLGNSTTTVTPIVNGSILDYFSDKIYIEITDIIDATEEDPKKIVIKGSTDGLEWSESFNSIVDIATNILIEDNIEIGLMVKFASDLDVKVGDRWIVDINSVDIGSPVISVDINFDILEPISYIKYMDISAHNTDHLSSKIKRDRFSSTLIEPDSYDARIGHLFISEGSVDKIKMEIQQTEYDVRSYNGNLFYGFDFNISEITGMLCKYKRHGALALKEIEANNISSVTIDTEHYIPEYNPHRIDYDGTEEDQASKVSMPKSDIEFNVILQSGVSRVLIPMLPTNKLIKRTVYQSTDLATLTSSYPNAVNGDLGIATLDGFTYIYFDGWKKYTETADKDALIITERVIPDEINHDQTGGDVEFSPASYTPRFKVDGDYDIKDSNPIVVYSSERMVESASVYIVAEEKVSITEYYLKDSHSVFYSIKLYKTADTIENTVSSKWTQAANDIFYMHYVDEDNKIHTAIRQLNKEGLLVPFSGTILGQIEMNSIDETYKTPMVFEYTLGII